MRGDADERVPTFTCKMNMFWGPDVQHSDTTIITWKLLILLYLKVAKRVDPISYFHYEGDKCQLDLL